MFWKKFTAIIASVFLILVSACNLPGGPVVVSGTNQDPTAAIQTRAAEIVASTVAAQTSFADAVASTLAAMATDTPEFTFTPSLTPTPTFTLTPSLTPTPTSTLTPTVPIVSVSAETNCRTGPGEAYDIVGVLQVGKTAEVVGRASDGGSWIIRNPANPATNCWLWEQYAAVTGNWQALPVITPPPTPTPAASFNVIFSSVTHCPAVFYAFNFQITNNGRVTWESNHVSITDQVTSETQDIARNDFPRYDVCAVVSVDQNLEAGEVGFTYYALLGNPAGHSITATIRVCSQDGMAGTCLEKTITFTP